MNLAAARKRITPLSPALFLAGANVMIGLHEETDIARGQVVELLLREVRQPMDAPWHTAFVHHVGYWSHYDHTSEWSSWPLPMSGDCNDLARFAKERGVLSIEHPDPGELFLLWSTSQKRFVHTGVVAVPGVSSVYGDGVPYLECVTIEGNTDEYGKLNGRGMHRTRRKLSPDRGDRFVRWVDLDNRAAPSEATESEICMGRMLRRRAA